MQNLRDFTYEELLKEVSTLGERPYRATQLYSWIYRKNAPSIDSMTDISKAFRERLKRDFYIGGPGVVDVKTSPDGTKKFLSILEDGLMVESVIIPDGARKTICVSTQAGCPLACGFCMTGRGGLKRDLTLSELTGQVLAAGGLVEDGAPLTNVVLMGMGEPLLNCDNVIKFVNILTDGRGFGLSHNKVTVSTAGIVPGIKRLGEEADVNLAVSLNAADDGLRSRLMPVNTTYPLEELMKALRDYPLKGKRHITVEYVLLKGVNDSDVDAVKLSKLLRGIRCKINLIPFNPFPGAGFERPSEERVFQFTGELKRAGYTAVVRHSKGSGIEAACGQLGGGPRPEPQRQKTVEARAR